MFLIFMKFHKDEIIETKYTLYRYNMLIKKLNGNRDCICLMYLNDFNQVLSIVIIC